MTIDVKICGIKTRPALNAALEAGATHVGFVFFPPSPRNIEPETAAKLCAACKGKAKTVALLVDPANEELTTIVESVAPDIIQLHGKETPKRVAQIKALTNRPVIKAISIATQHDAAAAQAYTGIADIILFDAKPVTPYQQALPGGNGESFDWQAISNLALDGQFMLSGGLNPDNVIEAINQTGARAVDVSSGVESSRGKKDPKLIRHFIETVHKCA